MDGPAGLGEKSARQNVNEHCGELQPRSPPPPPKPPARGFSLFPPFFPQHPAGSASPAHPSLPLPPAGRRDPTPSAAVMAELVLITE